MRRFLSIALTLALLFPVDLFAAGGKSFSGGGGARPSYTPSPRPSYTPSYKPAPPSYKPSPSPSPKPSNVPAGKSFSGGGSATPAPVNVSPSAKPKTVTVDMKAVRDHGTVQSREAYRATLNRSEAPKPSYTNKAGKTVTVDPKSKGVETVRNTDQTKWANRETRVTNVYKQYYHQPPVFSGGGFNDSFNPWFFMWLMERSSDDRARWVYHHREEMDPERYKQLAAKDKELEAKVKKLEAEKVKKDAGYVPPGLDPDLQYDDDFVDAAVNPTAAETDEDASGSSNVVFILVLLGIVFVVLIVVVFFVKFDFA